MAEYIDREKLLSDIEHYHVSDGKFQHWVEVQPAADVAPVVRCKDCKHEEICCRCVSRNNGEGFCSDGERESE